MGGGSAAPPAAMSSGGSRDAVGTLKLHTALILAQLGNSGYQLLSKVGLLDNGMNRFAYPVYRNVIACLLLGLMAFFLERGEKPPLTWSLIFSFFLLGLFGNFLNQTLYLKGLVCTNATFASAMQNFLPGWVFVMATLFRLEEVKLSRRDGQVKTLGAAFSVTGAAIMSFYKGPTLLPLHTSAEGKPFHIAMVKQPAMVSSQAGSQFSWLQGDCWQLGALCIIGNCLSYSFWILIQAPVLKRYPARLHVTFFSTCLGLLMLTLFGFTQIPDPSQWKVTTKADIFAIFYAGLINSGICYSLQSWCIQNGGPVLVAVYNPLQTLIIALLGISLLGDVLSVGSLVGGLTVICGLYLVTWGQGEELRITASLQETKPLLKDEPIEEESWEQFQNPNWNSHPTEAPGELKC